MDATGEAIERLYREHAGQVLGPLIRQLRDFDAAEDAFHEALIVALERWPRDGRPDSPGYLFQASRQQIR